MQRFNQRVPKSIGVIFGRDVPGNEIPPVQNVLYVYRETVGPLLVQVQNTGSASFTFSMDETDDANATNPVLEGAVDMRVNGADVTSFSVVPGGAVAFTIDPGNVTHKHLVLRALAAGYTATQGTRPRGTVTISYTDGHMREVNRR